MRGVTLTSALREEGLAARLGLVEEHHRGPGALAAVALLLGPIGLVGVEEIVVRLELLADRVALALDGLAMARGRSRVSASIFSSTSLLSGSLGDRGCSSRWSGTRDRDRRPSSAGGLAVGVDQLASARRIRLGRGSRGARTCRAPGPASGRRRASLSSRSRTADASDLGEHRHRPGAPAHSIVLPRTITYSTFSSARTSRSGSPATAIRSAE